MGEGMKEKLDIVLINPGDRKQVYQNLGAELAAIEPPFWVAVIAAFLRNNGVNVQIIDANAENISPNETAIRVNELNPLLTAVIVYGSNPSASTPNMTVAGKICVALKENSSSKVAIGGLHPSALPKRTLEEEIVDFVIEGEGPYTLKSLIDVLRNEFTNYEAVPGLWYYDNGLIRNNPTATLIKNMDEELPVAAWDLLPMHKYSAHNWHCFDNIENRAPYGAIYTSLGCPYSCIFCCINAPFGKSGIRYRSPQLVISEIEELVEKYGVRNLKIIDELFVLHENHYMTIVDLIIQRGYDLNIWAYARVDSIKFENLGTMKKAGINWLGLGIESASELVRDGVNKSIRKKDVKNAVRRVRDAGIRVGANYIFGLPDDTIDTMQETLDLAIELNTEWANFNCAMAYPGSQLYQQALSEGWKLPEDWSGYSQYSYNSLPLGTRHLKASEVLKFRDNAFHVYFTNPRYLEMIHTKFGTEALEHIKVMTRQQLKRKYISDEEAGNGV
jgi:radical SAM superfamily enzyme YgiQ (UPF0313 family)